MRISVTFYDESGAVYSVCNIIAADSTQPSIDAAVREQWTDPQIAKADVLTGPTASRIAYPAKP